MTAYLQPGDKIHITVPGDFDSKAQAEKAMEEIVAAYRKLGITVFAATPVIHSEQVTVVSVIRGPIFPKIRSAEKLKLVDDLPWQDPGTMEPLRAHWDPPALSH